MSISFYIQNRKGLFSYKAVETPLSLVSLVEGLEVVGLEGDKAYQSLDQVGTFLAVYWEGAGRGFEVYYRSDRETYQVRVLTPSTVGDWKGAILFMSRLAQKMKQDIVDEYGTTYTADGIFNIDFEADILYGLNDTRVAAAPMHVFEGYAHDLYMSQEKLLELFKAEDPVEEFGRQMAEMQQVQSQFSTPKYYKDQGGKYLGSYVLTEGVDTVLPTQPMPKGYLIKEMIESGASQDMEWHLHILIEDASSPQGYKYLTTKDLKAFLEKIPDTHRTYLDSSQIRIQPLNRLELEAILDQLPDGEPKF